ncbi:MAG: hypothetical protein IJR95_07320 [Lachnospiraceae bacterium]|nr:hypothetical protein [Lachnospiraceae bacterium]
MESYFGKKCNCCGKILTAEDEVILCPICLQPHHVSCWMEKQGCSSSGCPEQNPGLQTSSDGKAGAKGFGKNKKFGKTKKKRFRIPLLIATAFLLAAVLFVGFSTSWSGENLSRIMKSGSIRCLFGHEWKEATCVEKKHCLHCGIEEGEVLPHQWLAESCTAPKRCDSCGLTEGEALGHSWVEASCTEARHCSRCQTADGDALGHKWVEATCKEAKHCSVCHLTEGDAGEHAWVNATCTEAKHCSLCGVSEGKASGHRYVSATCTSSRYCKICKAKDGSPLGHHYQDYVCIRCKNINITIRQVPEILQLVNARYKVNSAGGIETYLTFRNGSSSKTIKYIDITIEYYNAVGDVIDNDIGGDKDITYRFTGPLGPGQTSKEAYWLGFYNSTFSREMAIKKVEIEYMDGSKLNLNSTLAPYIWR